MRKLSIIRIAVMILVCIGAREVVALDVDSVRIEYWCDRTNGVRDDYFFNVEVEGTNITDVVFKDITSGQWYTLTEDASGTWVYEDHGYADVHDLWNTYAQANSYQFLFNALVPTPTSISDYDDNVWIQSFVEPPHLYAIIDTPTHGETDVPVTPLIEWQSVDGASGLHAIQLELMDDSGNTEYEQYFGTSVVSHNIPPLGLYNLHPYQVAVRTLFIAPQSGLHTTADGDNLDFYGLFVEGNDVDFTTIDGEHREPEPATIVLVGTALLTLVGLRRRRKMQ